MTTDLHLPKIPNFEWVIFNRENHTYTDFLTGKELISVSRVRDSFKTPFDAARWAPLKAQERGITTADILQEWEAKKTAAKVTNAEYSVIVSMCQLCEGTSI